MTKCLALCVVLGAADKMSCAGVLRVLCGGFVGSVWRCGGVFCGCGAKRRGGMSCAMAGGVGMACILFALATPVLEFDEVHDIVDATTSNPRRATPTTTALLAVGCGGVCGVWVCGSGCIFGEQCVAGDVDSDDAACGACCCARCWVFASSSAPACLGVWA